MYDCDTVLESQDVPGHTHTCLGNHPPEQDHKCSVATCRRWFGVAQ